VTTIASHVSALVTLVLLASPATARAGLSSSAAEPERSGELDESIEIESRVKVKLLARERSELVDADMVDEHDEEPSIPDPEVLERVCEEVERLLHDEAENLGKSEEQLRDELEARGCSPSPLDKKTTDLVLYGAYPYASRADGYVLRRVPYWWSNPGAMRLFSGQVSVEGANAGRGVWGANSHFRGSAWRLGIETSHSFHLDRPEKNGLYHGDVHFVVAPVLRPRAVWWIGFGATWADQHFPVEDRRERGSGFSGTTSLDLFPVRPIVLSARIDAGKMGKGSLEGTQVLSARATAGVILNRFELYGGYEAKRIGGQSLRGPVLGLRLWF
jgi:hypothetical protein